MTIDRTPKPCLHPKANHQHGTHRAYIGDGCRCWPCVTALNEWERSRSERRINGHQGYTDADLIRAHVRTLMDGGATLEDIAREAGITKGSLSAIMYNTRRKRALTDTADTILAVTHAARPGIAELPAGFLIPSIGARRRVQALAALGWAQGVIAAHAGVCIRTISEVSWRDKIEAGNHQGICRAYDALWDKIPAQDTGYRRATVAKLKKAAQRRGWAPPLAWDDETIDEPAAKPNYGATEDLRMTLWKEGKNDQEIAAEVGINHESVRRWRKRNRLTANYERSPDLGNEGDNRHTLWQQGLTDADIGRTVGKHPDIIRRWRVKHGLASNRRTA